MRIAARSDFDIHTEGMVVYTSYGWLSWTLLQDPVWSIKPTSLRIRSL